MNEIRGTLYLSVWRHTVSDRGHAGYRVDGDRAVEHAHAPTPTVKSGPGVSIMLI
jgi:hypothetical protein